MRTPPTPSHTCARPPGRALAALLALLPLALLQCDRRSAGAQGPSAAPAGQSLPPGPGAGAARTNSSKTYGKPKDAELKARLAPMEYAVTQRDATEPAFRNRYHDHHEEGLYVDAASGEPLFSSRDKFDSGTGWPSFTRPVEPNRVVTRSDGTLGILRNEVRSKGADSHLGHVFDDGPKPTGLRYCINSAALRFIPAAELAQRGYAEYAPLFAAAAAPETAVLAGGCFWGMEELLRKIPGVLSTEVGYTGGALPSPTYDAVHTGGTGHAEAVRVVFDPRVLSYADLLERWFFRMHDPTTKDRQGNDRGTQYRSAIFFTSPEQERTARAVIGRVDASKRWPAPVVTEVKAAGPFTLAEDYHQDYLQKNPRGYTCHYLRD